MFNNDYNSQLPIGEAVLALNEKNSSATPTEPIVTHMIVDIAEILRAYSAAMFEAFNMGRQARKDFNANNSVIHEKEVL